MADDDAVEAYNAQLAQVRQAMRGRSVAESEARLRAWAAQHAPYLREVDVQVQARVMSDPRWARRHPFAALALSWSHRRSRPVHRTLGMLYRPTIAG